MITKENNMIDLNAAVATVVVIVVVVVPWVVGVLAIIDGTWGARPYNH